MRLGEAVYIAIVNILAISLFLVGLVDLSTSEQIGVESVPCIDNQGRSFEDELCERKIYCSWLGFATSGKCSEIRSDAEVLKHETGGEQ